MGENKGVQGRVIESDKFLIEEFKKNINSIKFLKRLTKNQIKKLKDEVPFNYQSTELKDLWKNMVGNSIVFLKGKDEREIIHDQMMLGVGKIHKYLEEYENFEKILYGTIDNYREHIIHVFRTYILGDYLIRNNFGYSKIDIEYGKYPISKEEKEAMWCIIALCHDLGYPLEKIHELNDPIRKILKIFGPISINEFGFNFFPQFTEISNFTIKFMSSTIQEKKLGKKKYSKIIHLQPKYYLKFTSALTNYNYGIMSSILLMKDLVYFKESDYALDDYKELSDHDFRHFLIRREILRSIASHDCSDIYYLNVTNFQFLLKAFDEMQEWGRPRLKDITKRGGTETKLVINKFTETEVNYNIVFKFPNKYGEMASEEEKKGTKEEIEEYFEIKCSEWMNVLRSAVLGIDNNARKLTVIFTVEDLIDTPVTYSLEHKNSKEFNIEPKKIKTKILKEKLF